MLGFRAVGRGLTGEEGRDLLDLVVGDRQLQPPLGVSKQQAHIPVPVSSSVGPSRSGQMLNCESMAVTLLQARRKRREIIGQRMQEGGYAFKTREEEDMVRDVLDAVVVEGERRHRENLTHFDRHLV
jgi:hypothetical protein